jgi:hypothetical protein
MNNKKDDTLVTVTGKNFGIMDKGKFQTMMKKFGQACDEDGTCLLSQGQINQLLSARAGLPTPQRMGEIITHVNNEEELIGAIARGRTRLSEIFEERLRQAF